MGRVGEFCPFQDTRFAKSNTDAQPLRGQGLCSFDSGGVDNAEVTALETKPRGSTSSLSYLLTLAYGAQWRGWCARRTVGNFDESRPVVLSIFWPGSPLWQSRQYFRARARRLSILSWRLHSAEQKHDPRATRFSEIWVLQRTQKRSIGDIEFRLEARRSGNPGPFFQLRSLLHFAGISS
jgi:hypothetical protein